MQHTVLRGIVQSCSPLTGVAGEGTASRLRKSQAASPSQQKSMQPWKEFYKATFVVFDLWENASRANERQKVPENLANGGELATDVAQISWEIHTSTVQYATWTMPS